MLYSDPLAGHVEIFFLSSAWIYHQCSRLLENNCGNKFVKAEYHFDLNNILRKRGSKQEIFSKIEIKMNETHLTAVNVEKDVIHMGYNAAKETISKYWTK